MTLGERIREARKRVGMSQELLAERMEVSRQAVAKWESDRSAPSAERLFRLAEVLGTTTQFLLWGDTETADPAGQAARASNRRARRRSDLLAAALVAAAYGCLYLLGRALWCGGEGVSLPAEALALEGLTVTRLGRDILLEGEVARHVHGAG